MENSLEKINALETEKIPVMGKSGAAFDYNHVAFDGDFDKLSQMLGENYAGLYLFATNNGGTKVLYKGESDDIAKALKDNSLRETVSALGATIFCYVPETEEFLRKDITEDICID